MTQVNMIQTARGVYSLTGKNRLHMGGTVLFRHLLEVPVAKKAGIPERSGCYMLIQPEAEDGVVYVGKSCDGGLPKRIEQHTKNPPKAVSDWKLTLLAHATSMDDDFSQDMCGALEHIFYHKVKNVEGIRLGNKAEPGGNVKLNAKNFTKLEALADFAVTQILYFLSFYVPPNSVSLADDVKEADTAAVKVDKDKLPSIKKLMDAGIVTKGQIFVPTRYDLELQATLRIESHNRFAVQLVTPHTRHGAKTWHSSVSAAAAEVSGHAENGFTFWKSANKEHYNKSLDEIRAEYDEQTSYPELT